MKALTGPGSADLESSPDCASAPSSACSTSLTGKGAASPAGSLFSGVVSLSLIGLQRLLALVISDASGACPPPMRPPSAIGAGAGVSVVVTGMLVGQALPLPLPVDTFRSTGREAHFCSRSSPRVAVGPGAPMHVVELHDWLM